MPVSEATASWKENKVYSSYRHKLIFGLYKSLSFFIKNTPTNEWICLVKSLLFSFMQILCSGGGRNCLKCAPLISRQQARGGETFPWLKLGVARAEQGDWGGHLSLPGQGAELDTGLCHLDQGGPFANVRYYKMGCVICCCCQHSIWFVFHDLIFCCDTCSDKLLLETLN